MADYSVNRAKHATLASGTVDTVSFAYSGSVLRVHNRDTTVYISFTIDGTTPTVDGDDEYVVAPGTSITISGSIVTTVKLIATGTPTYDVELY